MINLSRERAGNFCAKQFDLVVESNFRIGENDTRPLLRSQGEVLPLETQLPKDSREGTLFSTLPTPPAARTIP